MCSKRRLRLGLRIRIKRQIDGRAGVTIMVSNLDENAILREPPEPSVRLYVIQARENPAAVIFRRGPSKHVQLIKWNTDTDEFDEGQWFKGRIYERRCDLSPNGRLLVYFAANYKEPFFSWTAVSKTPNLTALALWPKGDGWGGGGLFNSDSSIMLNHRDSEMDLADGYILPSGFSVRPYGERPGWGEDQPILGTRLLRDGWRLIQSPEYKENKLGAPIWIEMQPPEIWERVNPNIGHLYLKMIITGLHERDGAWYAIEHEVFDIRTNKSCALGKTNWADWSRNGDLLFAREGSLFRLEREGNQLNDLSNVKRLIDFSANRFEAKKPSIYALQW